MQRLPLFRRANAAHELKLNIFPHLKEGIFGGYHPLPVIASTEGQCHSSTTINDMFRRSFSVSAMATGKIRLVITALLVSGVVFPRMSAELRNMSSHKGAVQGNLMKFRNCSPRYAARSYCLIMSAAFPSSAIWMASIGLYPSSAIVSR